MDNLLKISLLSIALFFTSLTLSAQTRLSVPTEDFSACADSINNYLSPLATVYGKVVVDSVFAYGNNQLDIHYSRALAEYPIRDTNVKDIYQIVSLFLPAEYRSHKVHLYSSRSSLEELSSTYYSGRETLPKAPKKKGKIEKTSKWITDASLPYTISKGLQDNYIAIWQSHGYYYEQKLQRWEWQRARIFQTVEDLYTQSYVLPFLVPMMENAGATVSLPRERDCQIHELIVDNDNSPSYSETNDGSNSWKTTDSAAFANPKSSYETGENPFRMGTARYIEAVKSKGNFATAFWPASVPESGEYAVYVSYQSLPTSTQNARYTIKYHGGEKEFIVNQTIGGGTWVYLGAFTFSKESKEQGVILDNGTPQKSKYRPNTVVVADAVKFGGGMGNIARNPGEAPTENRQSAILSQEVKSNIKDKPRFCPQPETSGYPRYTEGSRYWLQWAGFADTVYTPNKNMNDYNDDYMSRGRWVNVLSGGSSVNPLEKGFGVPVDLSIAFHTDAGTTLTDSLIGTLSIYTKFSNDKDIFPTGEPRIVSRELADLIQTQIVNDVRSTFEYKWERRGLWDRSYSESRTPEVPSMLLEFLSHQNFADMRYGLDPSFRFTVSRAIYKGVLRFLSERNGFEYIVQPLPVSSFSAIIDTTSANTVKLSWKAVEDPLEATATPSRYVVYTRESSLGNSDLAGFDNGIVVEGTSCTLPIQKGVVYSYKVVALNDGGASFPSEILSVGLSDKADSKGTILIVNGFNRVSAPASYATRDSSRAGFLDFMDSGVPYLKDFSYIGKQHEYRREIPWMDDDAPGFGASYADYETKVIAGNTFDYTIKHGTAMMRSGYSFVSSSREAVTSGQLSLKDYPIVDFIMGKQVTTMVGRKGACNLRYEVFPALLQQRITDYCTSGGKIIVSGAYIATDIWDSLYSKDIPASEREAVNASLRKMRSIYRDLNITLDDLKAKESRSLLFNDSIGITYFQPDTALYNKIATSVSSSFQLIDTISTFLNTLSEEISRYEESLNYDAQSRQFAMNILKFRWMTNYASATGEVKPVQNPFGILYSSPSLGGPSTVSADPSLPGLNRPQLPVAPISLFDFNTKPNEKCYAVESPDGLVPVGANAFTLMRYADNNISAGVAYKGNDYSSVALGFPIESLSSQWQIDTLMGELLRFLDL